MALQVRYKTGERQKRRISSYCLQSGRMRWQQRLKQLVEMGDFFNSSQMLRFQKENEYRTLTGGIISICIIITIIISFASMILDTLNLSTINYTQNALKRVDPSLTVMTAHPDNNFMFAIEVWRQNLSAPIRYFDIVSVFYYEEYGISTTIDMPLVQCTQEHWTSMPELVNNFDKLQISGWLCPPLGSKYELFGKYSSQKYQQMAFLVYPCNNATDPSRPCAPQADIDQMFADNGDYFYFTFYFINTVINPDNPTYKSFYLQDEAYVIFGKGLGTETRIYFSDYTINTDYSIWPFTDQKNDIGFMAESLNTQHPYAITQEGTPYVGMYINKDARSLIYQRQVQKLSTVFSFMGGLIGALMAVMFIINAYTSFSFEISIAFEVFKQHKPKKLGNQEELKGSQQKSAKNHAKRQVDKDKQEKSFFFSVPSVTFFDFIKFNFFSLIKSCSKKVDWPIMQQISEARRQILHQLDIKSLIKRIIFLEYSLTYLFEDYQLEGLQLNKPTTPATIRAIRQKVQMVTHSIDKPDQESEQSDYSEQSTVKPLVQESKSALKYSLQMRMQLKDQGQELGDQLSGHILSTPSQKNKKNHVRVENLSHRASDILDQRQRAIIRKRTNNLLELKDSAQQGDGVSRKIWRNLLKRQQKETDSNLQQIPVQWVEKK